LLRFLPTPKRRPVKTGHGPHLRNENPGDVGRL
jgi:hypothetical protein